MQTRSHGKRPRPPSFSCRFEDCGAELRSVVALRAHHRAHTGDTPWRCTEDGCPARFAARRGLSSHVKEMHSLQDDYEAQAKPTPSLGELERAGVADSNEEEEVNATAGRNAAAIETEVRSEAVEIANNCAYFATQLRAARGPAIKEWADGDFQNAHGWAVYVCDQLDDFEDERAVSDALRAKNLSLRAMHAAERALFDSVLGYDGLSAEILSALCVSIATPRSENALADALAATMRRKAALSAAHRTAHPSAREVLREAAARVLCAAHARNRSAGMHAHMAELAGSGAGCELLLREAVLAGADDEVVARAAVTAVLQASAEREDAVFAAVHPDIAAKACELSFPLFDRYVGHLLVTCAANDAEGNSARGVDTPEVVRTEDRLRRLLECEGSSAALSRAMSASNGALCRAKRALALGDFEGCLTAARAAAAESGGGELGNSQRAHAAVMEIQALHELGDASAARDCAVLALAHAQEPPFSLVVVAASAALAANDACTAQRVLKGALARVQFSSHDAAHLAEILVLRGYTAEESCAARAALQSIQLALSAEDYARIGAALDARNACEGDVREVSHMSPPLRRFLHVWRSALRYSETAVAWMRRNPRKVQEIFAAIVVAAFILARIYPRLNWMLRKSRLGAAVMRCARLAVQASL